MSIKVKKLVKDLNLELVAGQDGKDNTIADQNVERPGLEFAGFYDFFQAGRVFLIGSKEISFLNKLDLEVAKTRVKYIFRKQPF